MATHSLDAFVPRDNSRPPDPMRSTAKEKERYFRDVVLSWDDDACLDWPYVRAADGYGRFNRTAVHRLVCELTHGPSPAGTYYAAHACGRPSCCNPKHIGWKTPAENCADKHTHGTINRGTRNGAACLNEELASAIMELKGRATPSEISRKFGVGRTTVRDILDGKTWAWLFAGSA